MPKRTVERRVGVPRPSHEAMDHTRCEHDTARRPGDTWQVFGLVSEALCLEPGLLTVASQDRSQCFMTAVVLTYRCGAAPESHRIPSCDERPGWPFEPRAFTTIYGNNTVVTTHI